MRKLYVTSMVAALVLTQTGCSSGSSGMAGITPASVTACAQSSTCLASATQVAQPGVTPASAVTNQVASPTVTAGLTNTNMPVTQTTASLNAGSVVNNTGNYEKFATVASDVASGNTSIDKVVSNIQASVGASPNAAATNSEEQGASAAR